MQVRKMWTERGNTGTGGGDRSNPSRATSGLPAPGNQKKRKERELRRIISILVGQSPSRGEWLGDLKMDKKEKTGEGENIARRPGSRRVFHE